jgi:hypothetical protein
MDCAARVRFLYNVLRSLEYANENLLLAGSAAMHVLGILEPYCPRDLDVLVKDEVTWQLVLMEGRGERVKTNGFEGVRVKIDYDGDGLEDIDFTNSWPMCGRAVNDLFESEMVINDVHYMGLHDVIVTKRVLGRRKDMAHLALIQSWYDQGSPVEKGVSEENVEKARIGIQSGFAYDISQISPRPGEQNTT